MDLKEIYKKIEYEEKELKKLHDIKGEIIKEQFLPTDYDCDSDDLVRRLSKCLFCSKGSFQRGFLVCKETGRVLAKFDVDATIDNCKGE
jgi:hypothetical protein